MLFPHAHIRYTLRLRNDGDEWIESFPSEKVRADFLKAQRRHDKKNGTETYVMDSSTAVYNFNPANDSLTWLCDCADDLVAEFILKAFKKEA